MAQILNSHGLPAAAYAYTPDRKDPTTWKLPLWECDKGLTPNAVTNALSVLEETLKHIPDADHGAVRAKIRSACTKLDMTGAKPIILDFDFSQLAEAATSGKTADLVIISPGFNKNKSKYYPSDVLARSLPLFEGAKMYIDHQTSKETQQRPEGSIRNWAAVLRNVRVDESGAVVGTAFVHQPELRALLANLKEADALKELGVSIRGFGRTVRRVVEGVKTLFVETIEMIRSVDFVTEAGAGGYVSFVESDQMLEELTIETLQSKRPDLLESLLCETTNNGEHEMELHQLEEAVGSITEKVDALTECVSKLTEGLDASTKENKTLNKQLTESQAQVAKAQVQTEIAETINASTLPNQAKDRLKETFKEADTIDGIDKAIKAEAEYISKFSEAGKPTGLGRHTDTDKPDLEEAKNAHTQLKESFKKTYLNQGKTNEEAESLAEAAATGR